MTTVVVTTDTSQPQVLCPTSGRSELLSLDDNGLATMPRPEGLTRLPSSKTLALELDGRAGTAFSVLSVAVGRAVTEAPVLTFGFTLPLWTVLGDDAPGSKVTVTQNVLVDRTVVVGSAF